MHRGKAIGRRCFLFFDGFAIQDPRPDPRDDLREELRPTDIKTLSDVSLIWGASQWSFLFPGSGDEPFAFRSCLSGNWTITFHPGSMAETRVPLYPVK